MRGSSTGSDGSTAGSAEAAGDRPGAGFTLADFLPYRLSVTTNRISRAFAERYSRRFGLSIPEWRVLAVLGSFAPLSSNEICERTAMDKAKVSRAVALLTGKGLVDRAPHPEDQRLLRLSLSVPGRRTFEAVVPIAEQLEAELTAALSESERAILLRCLERLAAAAAGLGDAAPPAAAHAGRNPTTGAPVSPADTVQQQQENVMSEKNQGEGNKTADRAYRKDTEDFIDHNDVEKKAKEAAKGVKSANEPLSPAEKAGRDRAAGFDPKVANRK